MNKKEIIEKLKSVQLTSEHIMNEKIDKFEDALEEEGYIELLVNKNKLSEYLVFLSLEVEQAADVFLTISNIINTNKKEVQSNG